MSAVFKMAREAAARSDPPLGMSKCSLQIDIAASTLPLCSITSVDNVKPAEAPLTGPPRTDALATTSFLAFPFAEMA